MSATVSMSQPITTRHEERLAVEDLEEDFE